MNALLEPTHVIIMQPAQTILLVTSPVNANLDILEMDTAAQVGTCSVREGWNQTSSRVGGWMGLCMGGSNAPGSLQNLAPRLLAP